MSVMERYRGVAPETAARELMSTWTDDPHALVTVFRVAFFEDLAEACSESHYSDDAAKIALAMAEAVADEEAPDAPGDLMLWLLSTLDSKTRASTRKRLLFWLCKSRAGGAGGVGEEDSVRTAVAMQEVWARQESPDRYALFRDLSLGTSFDDLATLISRIFAAPPETVRWRRALALAAVLLAHHTDEMASKIKEAANTLLSRGLDTGSQDLFTAGLLLARQGCLSRPAAFFCSYQVWFEKTFGSETTSLATPNRRYTTLIRYLNALVPYETARHLRAHKREQPFVPASMRQLVDDYKSLANTRIEDLKERALAAKE